ncbi:MAG: sensor histidine kinase [Cyclobacteriaceae bacterium]
MSILGVAVIQVFWFRKAFDHKEKEFSHNVHLALQSVSEKILRYNGHKHDGAQTVKQLSSNYYVVMVNDEIDANILEVLLKEDFGQRALNTDFEYGIYDCVSDQMVYGNYISWQQTAGTPESVLPKWEQDNYYFGVYFPNKTGVLLGQMGIWIFSSLVLLLIVIFFSYTLFVIIKQRRLSEVHRDFVNNMTHEFKTPISTILISSNVLKKDQVIPSGKLKKYAEIIHQEAKSLKDQVDRVLQMARTGKERIKLDHEILHLDQLIKESAEHLAIQHQSPIPIQYNLQATDHKVNGDRMHLSNMIFNLLDNAMKYSNGKDPAIEVHTGFLSGQVIIQVIDNGIGISSSNLSKIFNKFYRVPTGNLHNVKGFGLGLHYVKAVVQAHGGSISVESELHKGSIFKIHLPSYS